MLLDRYAVVVIGTSAGGTAALPQLLRQLPTDLPAAILIVQHLYAQSMKTLPSILAKASTLPVRDPSDGEKVEAGIIYVAPPDSHLVIHQPGVMELSRAARENRHRPAIDPLFRSAARAYGNRTIGVLLTGTMDDGVAGLLAIKMREGIAIVQDPNDADYGEMPQHALTQVDRIDYVAPLVEIPRLIVQATQQIVNRSEPGQREEEGMAELSEPTTLICPECGGALQPSEQETLLQYRCHVGHVYGLQSLQAAYGEKLENTLWAALRAFREQNLLLRNMVARTTNPRLREEYLKQIDAGEDHAQTIHTMLLHLGMPATP